MKIDHKVIRHAYLIFVTSIARAPSCMKHRHLIKSANFDNYRVDFLGHTLMNLQGPLCQTLLSVFSSTTACCLTQTAAESWGAFCVFMAFMKVYYSIDVTSNQLSRFGRDVCQARVYLVTELNPNSSCL
jgi:hypothetical protein